VEEEAEEGAVEEGSELLHCSLVFARRVMQAE
jgi:hypothetical protein